MAFSFFMRDQPALEQAAIHMIPYASGRSRIKLWDAGCAFGQETYTLAMIPAERMNRFGFKNVRIDATDHDSANRFGEAVSEAVYHGDELIRTPEDLLGKYFEPAAKPGYSRVRDELRSRVRFRYHDLLSPTPAGNETIAWWSARMFSCIFNQENGWKCSGHFTRPWRPAAIWLRRTPRNCPMK